MRQTLKTRIISPCFMLDRSGDITIDGKAIVDALSKSADGQITLNNPMGGSVAFKAGGHLRILLGLIDGTRSIGDIIDDAHKSMSDQGPGKTALLHDLGAMYEFFNSIGRMLLKHKSLPALKTGKQLQADFKNRQLAQ